MKDDGGPAFPTMQQCGASGEYWMEPVGGMSLRDYFAAQAMQGAIARGVKTEEISMVPKMAYLMAEAMIKERNK